MGRAVGRLSATLVAKTRKTGLHADGGGLYLQVTGAGARSWVYRFTLGGKTREMGLGSLQAVSLAQARQKATECRRQCAEGIDPIEARNAARSAARLEAARAMTFDQCATAYIEAHEASWRNAKHRQQWRNTLDTYAKPIIGALPVQDVDLSLVMKVLEPIWQTKTETASRLRGRIEAVLDWATVREFRRGENPARWKGHLDKALPSRAKVQKPGHHAALPYQEMAAFIETLRGQPGIAAKGLEFAILTAARTGEVIGARWSEIDLQGALWTVPADRMKAGVEHRVPLSVPALAILNAMRDCRESDWVFPGGRKGKPMSNMALLVLLRRMKRSDLTAHGFRSTFCDWSAEISSAPREVAEMALAHTVRDKVEAAYRRGDLLERRAKLMADWAEFCGRTADAGQVISLRRAAN